MELKEGKEGEDEVSGGADVSIVVWWETKRVMVGAGARALFYPTLLYNVVRNKIQTEFHWWNWIDKEKCYLIFFFMNEVCTCSVFQFVLLGAVPFPSDVHRLKGLGVYGVVTLNESYETLVPSSLYEAHGIRHLVLPTRDYLFAPSLTDICRAVDFIHENALHERSTYVHCKAGRGRSTTVVICYLVKYRQMTPDAAYGYVKSIRPRVLLASSQWKAVQEFYHFKVKSNNSGQLNDLIFRSPNLLAARDLSTFDDGSVVVITEADLVGYDPRTTSSDVVVRNEMWAIYQVKIVGEAALARLSCLWVHCPRQQKISNEKLTGGRDINVDIHVFS